MTRQSEFALELAAHDYPIFPLWPGSKVPMTPKGHLNASPSLEEAERIWTRTPKANIGIATGAAALLVVDLDWGKDENGRKLVGRYEGSGFEAWDRALAADELPDTYTVITRSSGLHIYFKVPEGILYRTCRSDSGLGATEGDPGGRGIDIIASTGYVVAEESFYNGLDYASGEPDPPKGWYEHDAITTRIADLPHWLAGQLPRSGVRGRRVRTSRGTGADRADRYPEENSDDSETPVLKSRQWVEVAVEGVIRQMIDALPGTRNNACRDNGYRMGRLIAANVGIDADAAIDALTDAALSTGLHPREVENTLGRALEDGLDNPLNIKLWRRA